MIFLVSLLLISISCNSNVPQNTNSSDTLINLDKGWHYRTGDSPLDENGHLLWLDDNMDSPNWIPAKDIDDFIIKNTTKSLWLRIKLPKWQNKNAGIIINGISQQVQIYLDDEMIYQFGNFASFDDDHYYGWRQHIVQLPPDISERVLTLRIWSIGQYTGIIEPVILAPMFNIIESQFFQNIDELFFAGFFVLLGSVILIMFIFLQRNRMFLGIAIFLLAMGFFNGCNSLFLQYLVKGPQTFFKIELFSLLALPIGAFLIIEPLVLPIYAKIINYFWRFALFFWILILVLVQIIPLTFLDIIYNLFTILITLTIPTSTFFIYKSVKNGGKQVRILFVGILLALLACIIEAITYYTSQRVILTTYNLSYIPIGVLCFVGSLTWIVVQQYIETYRQKESALQSVMESTLQSERMENEIRIKNLEAKKWQELDQMKSRFFANISHEFRTPLTLILGTAGQLLDNSVNDADQKKHRLLIKNSNRLLLLVNQLLDLSKLESGKMKLKAEYQDIVPQVRVICHFFDSLFKQKNITLAINAEPPSIKLYYDPDKMEKIIGNIISNALKFTPPDGKITVDMTCHENFEIVITDTGPGIAKEHMPYIFDRFYQAAQGHKQEQHGSGIGLALTRELVKLHHGEISAASEAGNGTSISIRLLSGCNHLGPDEIIERQETAASQEQDHYTDTPDTNSIQHLITCDKDSSADIKEQAMPILDDNSPILLIVEDNTDMQKYIRDIFVKEFQIILAGNGKQGVDMAIEYVPDIIISDVMMPDMDGFALCNKIKHDQRTSHIPLIMLTARSSQDSRIEGLTLGADDYLVKPFDVPELKTRVKNLIDQRQRLYKRFSNEASLNLDELAQIPADKKFLAKIVSIIENKIDDSDLNIIVLGKEIGLSRSQLYRKINALTGQSVSGFVRLIRLKHAARLLEYQAGTISEIAYKTGFSNPNYFRKCFKEQFGYPPSEHLLKS